METNRLTVGLAHCLTWPFLEVGTLPIEAFELSEESEGHLKGLGITHGYKLFELSCEQINATGHNIDIRTCMLRVWHSHLKVGVAASWTREFAEQFLAGFEWTQQLQGAFLDIIAGKDTVEHVKELTAALIEDENYLLYGPPVKTRPDPNARGRDYATACMAKRAGAKRGAKEDA